ncbi:STAS domain-containing protein [Thermomonospora umbrina]|uniref:Anti-sigma factor antagonist n=1 Tax=Thermomonospora umbrina TaxID=111806 RepID=A0A3D9SN45_9ACTN|nr:STAS domain-containing protein [Thermomonospora umbrina]REE97339.1 anti-anti-sigma factor [Thermomonospora umbrina]
MTVGLALAAAPSTVTTALSTPGRGPAEVSMPAPRRPGRTVVALHGNLDIAAAPALREHLIGTLRHSARIMVVDLSEVAFCDTAGLAVLLGTQRRAQRLGVTLSLAAPRPQVAKLLRVTGLERNFTVHAGLYPVVQARTGLAA